MFDPHIKAHARHRPHAVAVSSLQGDVTYGRFDADIDRIAIAILDTGLGQARLAAVCVANPYVHWLILLALGRLSIASASVGALGATETAALLDADLLITDRDEEESHGRSRLHVSPEWVGQALRQAIRPISPTSFDPDALARITLSSGTTGMPKKVGRSWSELSRFVSSRCLLDFCAIDSDAPFRRALYMLGLDTVNFYVMLTTWLSGATMLLASKDTVRDLASLRKLSPTMLSGSPVQLQMLVDSADADFAPFPHLTIVSSGSHLPPSIARTLRLRLSTNVWNMYASTEASLAARGQVARLESEENAVGWLEPGVNVEAVDDEDQSLPSGSVGILRLKTQNMVSGYLDGADATAQHFKNGWFYPGDIGSVSTEGLLRIEGRSGEVLNIGGVKLLPRVLEDAVLKCRGVKDAAAFVMSQAAGAPTPWLAIVREEGLDEREISDALRGLGLPPIHVGWVSEIPRNDRGKVQRDRLIAAATAMR